MQIFRFFSIKMMFLAILLLVVIEFIPESLYSQNTSSNTPKTNIRSSFLTQNETPSTTTPSGGRIIIGNPTPKAKTTTPAVSNVPDPTELKKPSMITQAALLSLLSILPFIIMILTSFLKIVVVLSLLRTALGVQNAPPNQVINGVALLLSLFIMFPTAIKMYEAAQTVMAESQVPDSLTDTSSSAYVINIATAATAPMKDFLIRNSSPKHQTLFFKLAYRGLPEEYRSTLKPDDLLVVIPSYITGQLKDAFEIGVLIYIPFFVIDLVTSNILLAMGMMMLSPVTISMPLKLFLLVMLDGWTLLIEGLVKTFL